MMTRPFEGCISVRSGTPMWDSDLKADLDIPPFTRAGYRGNEIAAAIARVQLRKMDRILEHTRGLKNCCCKI